MTLLLLANNEHTQIIAATFAARGRETLGEYRPRDTALR